MLLVNWSNDLKATAAWSLVLDATLDETLVRRFLPNLGEVTRIDVDPPEGAATVRQITDTPVGKNKIAPDPKRDTEEELGRKTRNAAKVGHVAELLAAEREGVGLITYKDTEKHIEHLPGNVITGHFNATRGSNNWEEVGALFVAGRPQPSEADVELIAEAIHFKGETEIRSSKYGTVNRHYRVADVGKAPCEAVGHPDPLVEAVRWQICEAEVLQSVARARPIRRSAETHVEIIIGTNVALPLRIDRLTTWGAQIPSALEVAYSRPVVPENTADLARISPDLFSCAKAVKDAKRAAWRKGEFPYNNSIIGEFTLPRPGLVYQLPGAGQRPRRAWCDPARCADPEAWLTERLGELKAFKIDEPSRRASRSAEPSRRHPSTRRSKPSAPMESPDMPRSPPVIEITPADFGTSTAELVPLRGPGISSGNILWTYGVVSENVLLSALEEETHPASGAVVKRTPIPRDLCSRLIVTPAAQLGIEVPVSESMRALEEQICKLVSRT